MSGKDYLQWPFFDDKHRQLETELDAWAMKRIVHGHGLNMDAKCRTLVKSLGQTGWLRRTVGGTTHDGAAETIDMRTICLIREMLARHFGLAGLVFAMQGLDSGIISSHGTPEQRERYLTKVARNKAIAALVLSKPGADSDVAAIACIAHESDADYVLDGEKTWISSGGIADFYIVFARSDKVPGSHGISVFIIETGTPGLEIAEHINVTAPHPLARLRFTNCRIPTSQRMGAAGEGFKAAIHTLDVFRTPVAAVTLDFVCRMLDKALAHATTRKMFDGVLADFQLTQAKLAQMTTAINSAALLTYHTAWQRDQGRSVAREAAMAKLIATEDTQQAIDTAVQMWDGPDVVSEQSVERLYREIRSLQIYKDAVEMRQLIIAHELLRAATPSAHWL